MYNSLQDEIKWKERLKMGCAKGIQAQMQLQQRRQYDYIEQITLRTV